MGAWSILVVLLALGLMAAACGGGEAESTTTGGTGSTGATGGPKVIRFTFAPDPVWDYLKDQGIKDQMEQEANIIVLDSPTWDEFGIYAGGHADVISTGDMEVPLLQKESGRPAVVFGMYNLSRNVLVTSVDNADINGICDIPKGSKIAIYSTVGPTIQWGFIAKKMCNTDYRSDGGDYQLTLADITSVAQLAVDKEVTVAQALPDFSVAQFMSGQLKILNDGKPTPEIIPENWVPGYIGPLDNIFMAGADWYDSHVEEVKFFLKLWQTGLDAWAANKNVMIESYPQHFSVTTPEEIQWMKDYIAQHDWFVTSVYLTDDWITKATELYKLMREAGFMGADEPDPRMVALTP
jgi:hypothetical protein